jgi:hypothetical protein
MRTAPPVSLRAGGGPLWRALRIGLPAVAGWTAMHWALAHAELATWPALPVPVLVGALVAWRSRERACEIAWDGRCWTADGMPGLLDVMIDLQAWVLLRLRPERGGAARWIAVSAAEAGVAWPALRVALFAPRPAEGADAGPPEGAGGRPAAD